MRRRIGKLLCNREYKQEVYSEAYSLSYIDSASLLSKSKRSTDYSRGALLPPALPPIDSDSFSYPSIDDSNDGFVEGRTNVDLLAIALDIQKSEREKQRQLVKDFNPTTTIEEEDEAIEIVRFCEPGSSNSTPTAAARKKKPRKRVDVVQYHARASLARTRALGQTKGHQSTVIKNALMRMRRSNLMAYSPQNCDQREDWDRDHFNLFPPAETRQSAGTSRSSDSEFPPSRIDIDSDSLFYVDSISTL